MLPENRVKMRNLIMKHEKFKESMYSDTTGNLTIGYGHNLKASTISQNAGGVILDDDIFWHITHLPRTFDFYDALSDARKVVLVDMSFNLGLQGLCEFHQMIEALKKGDYNAAADAMLDSKWAVQVGERAIEDAFIMRNDTL
jgi:lysozyme